MRGPLFVIGSGRCGSTVLNDLLGALPDVQYVSTLEDRMAGVTTPCSERMRIGVARTYRALARRPDRSGVRGRAAGQLMARCAPSEGYRLLGRGVSPALVRSFRDLTEDDCTPWLADRLRRVLGSSPGAPLMVHKFTGWPRIGLLHAAFPEARFVHVVRDGRAVANSLVQMSWWDGWNGPEGWSFGPLGDDLQEAWAASGRRFAVLAGIEWKLVVDAVDAARGRSAGIPLHEVRYEDFVVDPATELERIIEFAGLHPVADLDRLARAFGVRPHRSSSWTNELDPADVEAMHAVIGDTLERYGYDSVRAL